MSAQTSRALGNISLAIGEYEKEGRTRKRYKRIGTMMETTRENGEREFWMRLDADILHASLYALVRPGMRKGDNQFTASVFAEREDGRPPAARAGQEPETEAPEGDRVPF